MYCELYMKALFNELQSAYTIPSRTIFVIKIFDLCYEETKKKIEKRLRFIKKWNIIIDKFSNINKDRIINFCILTRYGPFSIKYQLIDIGISSAEKIAKWINELFNNFE
jgi:hypothetical protein